MPELVWEPLPPNELPCLLCVGTGSIYPMRKDGQPDMRFKSPSGPCPACGATGRRNTDADPLPSKQEPS